MKTKILLVVALMYVLVSCDKKEDPAVILSGGEDTINLEKPAFAEKTVAETKGDIENTGVKMVGELKSMNNDKGVQATVNLVDLASNSGNVDQSVKKSTYFKILLAVKKMNSNKPDAKVLFKALSEEKPVSLDEEFDSIAGVYSYNYEKEDFDFEANVASGLVVFDFPASVASRDSKTSDGKLTIYKPKFITGNFSALDASTTELPTELKYDLKVNSAVVTSFSFTASYQSDGIPTKVESKLTLGDFAFAVTYGYKETEVTANYAFTHGSTTILNMGATVGGTFTKTAIDQLEVKTEDTVYYCNNYDWQTGKCIDSAMYIETKSTLYPEKVLKNANAHFQFMDVKIVGEVNFTSLIADINKADENNYPEDSAASILNRDLALIVVYASDNKAIAKAEAYIKKEQVEDQDCKYVEEKVIVDWDYNFDGVVDNNDFYMGSVYKCEPVMKEEKTVDIQMVFADGSKSTMEAYFEDGFDNVIDSFNEFIKDLNKTYGWTIEQVEKE